MLNPFRKPHAYSRTILEVKKSNYEFIDEMVWPDLFQKPYEFIGFWGCGRPTYFAYEFIRFLTSSIILEYTWGLLYVSVFYEHMVAP